jgi:hypothetical protein
MGQTAQGNPLDNFPTTEGCRNQQGKPDNKSVNQAPVPKTVIDGLGNKKISLYLY